MTRIWSRAATGALHESRQEEQPEDISKREHDVCDGRCRQPDEQCWTPSVAIGEASPHWRRDQLRDRERRYEQPDDEAVGAEVFGVEGQEGNDHQQPHHVHERRYHQNEELTHVDN